MATKERSLHCRIGFGNVTNKATGAVLTPGSEMDFGGAQITESIGHPYLRKQRRYAEGGPFYTSRIEYSASTVDVSEVWGTSGTDKYYSGPVICPFPTLAERGELGGPTIIKHGEKTDSLMNEKGATAISIVSPTNPNSQLAVLLGEFKRDGFPSLPGVRTWKDRTLRAKNAGDEYLNYVFGWEPLVRETLEVGKAAKRHKLLLEQHQRGEGKNTKREFSYPLDEDRSEIVRTGNAWFPGHDSSFNYSGSNPKLPNPTRTLTKVTSSKMWFEGLFTYGAPSSSNAWTKALGYGSEAEKLFGITITPQVLWELTPWSWAVDWFSNAGDVINNVTNFGLAGQVMRYGYVMHETITEITASLSATGLKAYNPVTKGQSPSQATKGPLSSTIKIVTKRRAEANPFGFGIGWEGLSPTQLAITAALGITKLRP